MSKKPWWQEEQPLLISAVQYNMGDSNFIIEDYVPEYGFNTEQTLHVLDKDGTGFIVTYNDDRDRENLKEHLKKSRKKGIREIIYTNSHVMPVKASNEHPEWVQLYKDGNQKCAYGFYRVVCTNHDGSFHKYYLEQIKKLCELDIDGIFIDGPLMYSDGCYCDVCRKTFEEKYGHSIYDATRLELQELATDLATEHVKEVYETVKSINPNIALYINNSALRADVTGSNTRRVYDYVDLVGAEGGFHGAWMGTDIWHISSKAKHLEGIVGDTLKGDKPIVNFFAANVSSIPEYPHTPAEITLGYAQSFANGSNVWLGPHFDAEEFSKTKSGLAVKEINKFITRNKTVFGPSKVCARVALMWSQNTANNYASSVGDCDFVAGRKAGFKDRGDHYMAIMSAFNMLVRNHIQFDIIDEVSVLNGTINNYEAVIFPNVACMTDELAEKIADYVKNGGNILGNLDIGLYNANGSYSDTPKLAKVFGMEGKPELLVGNEISATYYFKEKDDEIINDISLFRLPGALLNIKWELSDDTEVIMKANMPKESVYEKIPNEVLYPSVFKHKYGKGTAYYISGNFYEFCAEQRNILDYAKIVSNFCGIASSPVTITDAAGLYEVVLRRQKDRFILHVINLTGAMARPLDKVVPLYDVDFKLCLDGFGIEKSEYILKSLRGANLKNISQSQNEVSFTLDKIDDYEIILVE